MPTRWNPDTETARHRARAVAREYLDEVVRGGGRVEAGAAGAVHDLRVALRRLRNWLRLWRPHLADTVSKRSEQHLGRLSRLAGAARDLEVQLQSLTAPRGFTGAPARHAAAGLARRIAPAYAASLTRLRRVVRRELAPAAASLGGQLRQRRMARDLAAEAPEPQAGPVLGRLIEERAAKLLPRLEILRSERQVRAAHAARIAVKRLRYLLDSMGRSSRNAAAAARRLARLQDALGELHDAQLLAARVAAIGSRSASVRALREQLGLRVARKFGAVLRERDSAGIAEAVGRIARLQEALQRGARGTPRKAS